jgi:hypothetical protein
MSAHRASTLKQPSSSMRSTVGAAAHELLKLQSAVETIKLDLSMGQVIELPLKMAVNADIDCPNEGDQWFGHGATFGAKRTKPCTKEIVNRLISSSHPGDLNPRPAVYETAALPLS